MIKPPVVEQRVAKIHATTIPVGLTLPYIIRREIIVVGIMVTPLVFNTKKVIILLLAVSFLGFNSCNDFIAFRTEEQRDKFLQHNEQLCKDYYMI